MTIISYSKVTIHNGQTLRSDIGFGFQFDSWLRSTDILVRKPITKRKDTKISKILSPILHKIIFYRWNSRFYETGKEIKKETLKLIL